MNISENFPHINFPSLTQKIGTKSLLHYFFSKGFFPKKICVALLLIGWVGWCLVEWVGAARQP
jgi:hypothetical protein